MDSPIAANVLGTIGAVSFSLLPYVPSVKLANQRVDLLVCSGQSSIHRPSFVCSYDQIN